MTKPLGIAKILLLTTTWIEQLGLFADAAKFFQADYFLLHP
jgi:hypothetical protein